MSRGAAARPTFLEYLLDPANINEHYVQEDNQCSGDENDVSLLALSHRLPASFSAKKTGKTRPGHYRDAAERYGKRYDLPPSLIMAIIKAESNFDPNAVSTRQAMGLMQIVPSTAGQEVYRFLNGYVSQPAADTLLHPEKNILYGTTYLHLLDSRYFQNITNPASRQLCIIAAYNGGPGAVLRVFDSNMETAIKNINALSPEQVYSALTTEMPHAESRRYVDAVLGHIRNFSVQ